METVFSIGICVVIFAAATLMFAFAYEAIKDVNYRCGR